MIVSDYNINAKTASPKGVYDISYFAGRQTRRALKYRLKRRTEEVYRAIRQYMDRPSGLLLDIGTADALMLNLLSSRLNRDYIFIGLDYSYDLLSTNQSKHIIKIQADALLLPIKPNSVSIVIATAVIEHVPDGSEFVRKVFDTLQPGGIFILTTPNPVLAHISEKIGLLKEPGHHVEYSLDDLSNLLTKNDFVVLNSYKFMFSPVGFPAERFFEKIIRALGLSCIMANQLMVGKKSDV